ncbi:HECT domain containing protein [Amanita muscaria]
MNSRLSLFAEEQRRKINLGGTSSAVSQAAVIDSARAKRLERFEQKRRQDSAAKIQEWWKGIGQTRVVRRQLRMRFERDVVGIDGLRCLVLLNKDEEALGIWSQAVLADGSKSLFALSTSAHRDSWLVLIRKLSLLLLRSVANAPQSPHAVQHLRVLNLLSSSKSVAKSMGPEFALQFIQYLIVYLVRNDMFSLISRLIQSIPIEAKSSPVLPHIIDFIKNVLSLPDRAVIHHVLIHILTIPLLPYRLPLKSLTVLSASMPLSDLHLLSSNALQLVDSLQIESRIHLLANLVSFVPPRYQQLNKDALAVYLRLLASLLNSLPLLVLDPSSRETFQNRARPLHDDDEDDDDDDRSSRRHPAVDILTPYPTPDTRTLKRIRTLHDSTHISTLLGLSKSHPSLQLDLITFLLALNAAWPAKKDEVLTAAGIYAAGGGGGLVRELYRGYVRGSVLGREENTGAILDPTNADAWPPLIFLADLYTQMLLTMGDDEFFGTGLLAASSAGLTRNPLSLDELRVFSHRLLIIAFTLFQREGQADWHQGIVAPNVRFTWENVREKMTKCLVAIHSRDSRRPFVPPDHWLVSSQVDMDSFIDAAIFEEQQLTGETHISTLFLSKRQIATMSPRLGILNNIPFAIPFEVRVSIFRHFIINDKVSKGLADRMATMHRVGRTRIAVRRGSISQDGFDRLADVDLKLPIEITFIDKFGQEEAGIDGGGVFKEFLTSLSKEVFDTDRGLWLMNKKHELYPNPHAYATESHSLNWYRFIGRILGKAMYEGILVDVAFAEFFLAKWLGRQSFLDDLASLDSELYKGLIYLKHYIGNLEDLSLNFTIVDQDFGVAKTVELVPDGSNIPVTRENRLQYIQLVSHYRLSRQIRLQSKAFFEGLSEMIDPKWLRMFNQHEVQILLGGVNAPIDVEDLRKHTNYGGLYDENHPTITTFWEVVNSFDQEQRRALLRFVTSCSRPPLLGFRELVPLFSIRDSGTDEERLPTASTCVNLLKLPRYQSEKQLRAKLLKAITSGAGFDLS